MPLQEKNSDFVGGVQTTAPFPGHVFNGEEELLSTFARWGCRPFDSVCCPPQNGGHPSAILDFQAFKILTFGRV